jgi:hypothetical protein
MAIIVRMQLPQLYQRETILCRCAGDAVIRLGSVASVLL